MLADLTDVTLVSDDTAEDGDDDEEDDEDDDDDDDEDYDTLSDKGYTSVPRRPGNSDASQDALKLVPDSSF